MNQCQTRFIHTMNSHQEIKDLLQTIFVLELLMPSKQIWLVSPWISDIPVLDNRANQFLTLEPRWARRLVTFSEVLAKLLEMGTRVIIATRPASHNETFLQSLREKAFGCHQRLFINKQAILHSKGLLGDDYYLCGSMNFTFNGITVYEESLQFFTDPAIVAENRMQFMAHWGGDHD